MNADQSYLVFDEDEEDIESTLSPELREELQSTIVYNLDWTVATVLAQDEDFQALIRRIVEESGISQAQLARDAGLSYAALHAWIIGARTPRTESLVQLAQGLENRSDALRDLAQQLRRAATSS